MMIALNLMICGAGLLFAPGWSMPLQDSSTAKRDNGTPSNAPNPPFAAQISNWTETQLTQLGVVLEQLEGSALEGILNAFQQSDFEAAGYQPWVRDRLLQMQEHDQAHLEFLHGALRATNDTIPQSCNYSITDFAIGQGLETALIFLCGLEETVENAYLGIAEQIEAKFDPVPQFATQEARHQSWLLSSVFKEEPWSGPWDTVLTADQAALVTRLFASSCPDDNPKFPPPSWPTAVVVGGPFPFPEFDGPAGSPIQISYPGVEEKHAGETWLNIQSGLGVVSAPIGDNGTLTVPENLQGFAWGMIVTTGAQKYTSDQIVAGPIGLHCGFNSTINNSGIKEIK